MLCSFFPNKNKVYSSRSLPEPAHSTSFLKMAIICRSGRGCKVALLCMHRSNRSFPCPTFFGNQCTSIQLSQPLIGFILPFAIWCSSSSFSVVFCLLHDYECMLPISRWNAVHYNIALCESQNCSRSETIPLLQIKFLSSSILIFIWDLMWVKYPVPAHNGRFLFSCQISSWQQLTSIE